MISLDSIPFDIFQTIIEELLLPALVSFASTRKSQASVPTKAMHARTAQMKAEEEAAAAEALRSHIAHLAKEESRSTQRKKRSGFPTERATLRMVSKGAIGRRRSFEGSAATAVVVVTRGDHR